MITTLNTVQMRDDLVWEVRKAIEVRPTERLWNVLSQLERCVVGRSGNKENEYELIFTPSAWDDFLSALSWHAAITNSFVVWSDFWNLTHNFATRWSDFETEGDYRAFYGSHQRQCGAELAGKPCLLGENHGSPHDASEGRFSLRWTGSFI